MLAVEHAESPRPDDLARIAIHDRDDVDGTVAKEVVTGSEAFVGAPDRCVGQHGERIGMRPVGGRPRQLQTGQIDQLVDMVAEPPIPVDKRFPVDFQDQVVLDGTSREYVGAVTIALIQGEERTVVRAVKVMMHAPVPRPGDVSVKIRLEESAEAPIAVDIPIRVVVPEKVVRRYRAPPTDSSRQARCAQPVHSCRLGIRYRRTPARRACSRATLGRGPRCGPRGVRCRRAEAAAWEVDRSPAALDVPRPASLRLPTLIALPPWRNLSNPG